MFQSHDEMKKQFLDHFDDFKKSKDGVFSEYKRVAKYVERLEKKISNMEQRTNNLRERVNSDFYPLRMELIRLRRQYRRNEHRLPDDSGSDDDNEIPVNYPVQFDQRVVDIMTRQVRYRRIEEEEERDIFEPRRHRHGIRYQDFDDYSDDGW